VRNRRQWRCRSRIRGGGHGDEELGSVEALVVLEVGGAVAVAAAPEVLWI
jgi:hypothetical protein